MLINNVNMLVTSVEMKERKADTGIVPYASVGLVSMDDGKPFTISVMDQGIYSTLKPFVPTNMNLMLIDSKYGLKLSICNVNEVGQHI